MSSQSIKKPTTQTDFQFRAYNRYQMDWFSKRNMGVNDIWRAFQDSAITRELLGENAPTMKDELGQLWVEVLYKSGFNGEIFHTYNDFLHSDYKDADYMQTILSEAEYKSYCEYEQLPYPDEVERFAKTHTATECLKAFAIHEAEYRLSENRNEYTAEDVDGLSDDFNKYSEEWINGERLEELTDEYIEEKYEVKEVG